MQTKSVITKPFDHQCPNHRKKPPGTPLGYPTSPRRVNRDPPDPHPALTHKPQIGMLSPVPPSELTFNGPDDQVLVARAPRQLTEESTHEFRALIANHLPNRDDGGLVIDMAGVYLISSVGITCLLEIRERCADRRIALRLAGLVDSVQQMLEMLRLTEKFQIHPNVESAVDDLLRGSPDAH